METNEHAHETRQALVRPAVDGETWAEWMPEIQNAGVDTWELVLTRPRAPRNGRSCWTWPSVSSPARGVHLRVQREADVSNLGDLLLYGLDDLEEIAAAKGGIRKLLDEKWRKVYRANAPRGLFRRAECRAA